ncbi:MAG: hypothetical protein PHV59_01870 [Victivallales bacterium]|nr:hypothetical protein [Victivallales bacterium]
MGIDKWDLASATMAGKAEIVPRLYFFGEKLPEAARNVHHVCAPVEKCEISFAAKSGYSVLSFASSIVRLDNGSYRFYATSHAPDFSWMKIGIWESDDGLKWAPRELVKGDFRGLGSNFIAFENLNGAQDFTGQPQVVRLKDGRWRMYFWKFRDNHARYITAVSEDGLRWKVENIAKPVLYHPKDEGFASWAKGLTLNEVVRKKFSPEEILERKRLSSNDATFVYYNRHCDRFECYSVWLHEAIPARQVAVDSAAAVLRIIHRRLSEDGLNWSDPELILIPDSKDPWDLQFYFLAVQNHDDWKIGSLGHYRVEAGQQSMDIELCFSRDGKSWERPLRGAFIKRGAGSGAKDSMGIYAPNAWLDRGDKWLCLYSGTPNAHNSYKYDSGGIAGATFAKNRFVGLAAGKVSGGFLSESFILQNDAVMIDADIRGYLKAELCDAFGCKREGFNLSDSVAVSGDGIQRLQWNGGDISAFRYRCCRLRFEYEDGEIYNIHI